MYNACIYMYTPLTYVNAPSCKCHIYAARNRFSRYNDCDMPTRFFRKSLKLFSSRIQEIQSVMTAGIAVGTKHPFMMSCACPIADNSRATELEAAIKKLEEGKTLATLFVS